MAMQKNSKTLLVLVFIVVAMFGFGFALVPLYNVFCDVTGLNGKTNKEAAAAYVGSVDTSRTITVEFLTTNNAHMPWKFYSNVHQIKLHPGESRRVNFYAKNLSDHSMTGQAIPSVAPSIAARYLLKTECFCFRQQTLKAGESIDMPVIFHIERELPKKIRRVTLSYTMFDAGRFAAIDEAEQGKIK
ncbi:MAG: cytochrome c oxidase assembly protein [Gammaproteobacteria bacterium]|nr:cytochrome c oxidase assembly protein [Gammaproteobacteria bacterium]